MIPNAPGMTDPPNLPEFKSQRATGEDSSKSSGGEADHLTGFRLDELGDDLGSEGFVDVGPDGEVLEELEAVSQNISREAFFEVFSMAFAVPGMVDADFAPVSVQDHEKPQARQASDSLYRLLEIYYPAALAPQSELVTHLFTLGTFLGAKAMLVRSIMMAKAEASRSARQAPKERADSAPQGEVETTIPAGGLDDATASHLPVAMAS